MIRRRPTSAGCWAEAETAIVSVRKRWHRRLLRMTDLLLGMCEPVRIYVSRAVARPAGLVEGRKKRQRNGGMPTNCAPNIETSTTKPISKGITTVSVHFDALVFNDEKSALK